MISPKPHAKVLFAGIMSLVLTLGVARFAYTPLLPIMQQQTALGDASGGWLATFNYFGYMLGALIAASISDIQLKDRLYRGGLILALITTAGMAMSENLWLWGAMRFLAGLSSAAGVLLGAGLVLNWLIRNDQRKELGIHFSGIGFGIVLSAIAVKLMSDHFSWEQQWLLLTLIGLFLLIPAWSWLPRPDSSPFTTSGIPIRDRPPTRSWMLLLLGAYFCAGFGYVVSATFLVVIVESVPGLREMGEWTWLVVGLAAAPACILWDRLARVTGELPALALAFALEVVGIIIPTLYTSLPLILLSAVLYGATFIGIVSLMLTMIGKLYPTQPAKPMAKLTLSYGVAQVAAPAMAGSLAERAGDYTQPLYLATLIMSIGLFLILLLISRQRLPNTQLNAVPPAD